MPLPGEVWKARAEGKERWVIVLAPTRGARTIVVYGTSRAPWEARQEAGQWRLLLHLSPRDNPAMGLDRETYFYVQTVRGLASNTPDAPLGDFIRPLCWLDGVMFVDLQITYFRHHLGVPPLL